MFLYKVFKDEHRRNEWKLSELQRPHLPFDDDTICAIEVQRDEFAAQVAGVYNEQGLTNYRDIFQWVRIRLIRKHDSMGGTVMKYTYCRIQEDVCN